MAYSQNSHLVLKFATIFLALLNLKFPTTEPASLSITTDKEALISFISSLSFEPPNPFSTWALQSPLSSPCNWTGVICNKPGLRVVGLDLSGLRLSGSISPHIGNLSFLNSLQLQNNRFTGPIPDQITKLSGLRVLNMSFNLINGVLPLNLSQLKELKVLDLTENSVSGRLPEELSLMTKLEVLKLRQNHFHGEIPHSLANLSSLTILNLGTNNLNGDIPFNLGLLYSLKELDITINNLTGEVPPSIYNLTSLVVLAVASNQLWGEIQYNIGVKLPNLLVFNFCINKFTGRIPGSLHNLTRIRVIRMAHNLLEGPVLPGLGNLPYLKMYNIGFNKIVTGDGEGLGFITSLVNSTQLEFLAFDGNGLEGVIPEAIGNLSKVLKKLYMGGNRIHGEIPISIARLRSLTLLNLSSNLISGEIPTQIGELKELQELGLANNNISGAIPRSLGNLIELNRIDLSGNSLLGHVPSSFGNFKNLLSMDLSNNKLNGSIPKECLSLPSLSTVLNLSRNLLSGPLPQEIGGLENVVTIDLSHNLLSGQIPNSIKDCKSLEKLLMQNNGFSGPIPKALGELKGLEILDLSSNQLSGFIPESFQELQALKYLNLSFNDLEGLAPEDGIFRNMSSVHLEGNKKLCFDSSCKANAKGHKRRSKVKVLVITSVLATLGLCVVVGSLIYIKRSKEKVIDASQAIKGPHPMVSYEELRRETGNFSHENLVGNGSFGSVYKGYLREHGNIAIAVKVLKNGSWKSFAAECEALRNMRHRNLVRLVTSCSSIDFKNQEFLALVYEYMGNGSLEDWIRGKRRKANGSALNIVERLQMAIDIACALDYMHHDCEVPVVHCDIKPSNILLDEDLTAKLGDFGLARLLMIENRDTQTSISSTHVLKGSIGYIPPEYGLGEKPSTVGDAYSFGVMLLEFFTGKSPTNESFTEELNLSQWVQSNFPERLLHIVDSELIKLGEDLYHQGQHVSRNLQYDCLTTIIEIGLSCTANSPNGRMNMRNALHNLKAAKSNLLKDTTSGTRVN